MKKSIIIILTLSMLFISGCKKTDKEIDNNKQDTNNTVTEPENNNDNNANSENQEQPTENINKQLNFELTKMHSIDNNTTIEVKTKNISNETYTNTNIKIILLDEEGKEITNFTQVIDEIKPQEEKIISVNGELDSSKVKKINYEVID